MKSIEKKQSYDYELIAMSFHESGHVVIAIYNYLNVDSVNVMTPTKTGGNTDFFTYDDKSIDDEELKKTLLLSEIQVLYAGLVAEKMYYKDICGSSRFPMHLKTGSSFDIQEASKIIRKFSLAAPGKNTHLLKKKIQNELEPIISEHWDAIKVIAHSLYQKKKLSFDEIKYLLTRKTDHKDFWKERFRKIKTIHAKDGVEETLIKDTIS